jgi:hypothetical protein
VNDIQLLLLAAASIAVVYTVAFLHKARSAFLYSIPAINVLAGLFVSHRVAGGLHPGELRVVLLLGFILLMLPLFRLNRPTSLVLLFVAYLFVLVPLASEPLRSLQGVMKPAIALLMLPLGYAFFKQVEQLNRLHYGIVVAVVILLVNFVLAQVFKFGQSPYAEDVYVGGGATEMAYVFAYSLLMMPLVFRILPASERSKRIAFGVLLFAALVVMFIVFRRGALLGLACGLAVFTLLSPARRSVQLVRFGAVAALLFMFSSPLYIDTVRRMVDQRGDITGFVSNTETGRMAEFGKIGGRVASGSFSDALFGSEPFNSRAALGTARSLHVDYMNLLSGTGLVGLSLYLLIHVVTAWELFRRARTATLPIARELRDTGYAIMATSIVISFSSQIYMITSLSLVFLYLGALLGVLTHARQVTAPVQPRSPFPIERDDRVWTIPATV